MKPSDRPFVVGRRTRKGTTLVLLRGAERPVFPGPWTLRAVVTPNQERPAA